MLIKAMGSKVYVGDCDSDLAIDFYLCIRDLINTDEVGRLGNITQHMSVSRLQHSINVAYYSYLICEFFGLDSRAAARGGLLHDLFYYDYRELQLGVMHIIYHPEEALRNASKLCELSDLEKDIIRSHMWPASVHRPGYKESHVVSLVDKYCATIEFAQDMKERVRRGGRKLRKAFRFA